LWHGRAGEESELIAAAREQAEVALSLAKQVESAAGGNPQTLRAIAQLREAAQRVSDIPSPPIRKLPRFRSLVTAVSWGGQVIQAAHGAAAKPGDADAQRELADAQHQLATAIRAVVDSHDRSRGNQAVPHPPPPIVLL
jgi:hypothetical protein